ncbi:MAG: response regulator [Anaerolineae bacterium]|nr:response regulator [Anaerolineae bacterium]
MTEKPHILIVEDDLDLSEMLHSFFHAQGYDVATAMWGEDAVRLSQDQNFNLIMLDIRLPDIDGYEVCRRLRTDRRTQSIPVIFLTEKRDRVDKLAGLELGVVDYITKPFDIQELRLRVRNTLGRAVHTALMNAVTNLPEGDLVNEKLRDALIGPDTWGILSISIDGLDKFRELYGFVAADDVLRAVTLMMNNAIREAGNESDFIGHLKPAEFIIITDGAKVPTIKERIEARIKQSMEYFYPLKDRDKAKQAMLENRLQLMVSQVLPTDKSFDDVESLKEAITSSRVARG